MEESADGMVDAGEPFSDRRCWSKVKYQFYFGSDLRLVSLCFVLCLLVPCVLSLRLKLLRLLSA